MHPVETDHAHGAVRVNDHYDRVTMAFHWTTLGLLALMFWTAWARAENGPGGHAAWLLETHRSIGVLLWLLTLARIGWKAAAGRAPPLPATIGKVQRRIARGLQGTLYALLVLQPMTGFLHSIWRGRPFAVLGSTFPAIVARDTVLSHLFHEVHETGGIVLLALIGLHAGAALYHGIVRRDGVLGSMLPQRRSLEGHHGRCWPHGKQATGRE